MIVKLVNSIIEHDRPSAYSYEWYAGLTAPEGMTYDSFEYSQQYDCCYIGTPMLLFPKLNNFFIEIYGKKHSQETASPQVCLQDIGNRGAKIIYDANINYRTSASGELVSRTMSDQASKVWRIEKRGDYFKIYVDGVLIDEGNGQISEFNSYNGIYSPVTCIFLFKYIKAGEL